MGRSKCIVKFVSFVYIFCSLCEAPPSHGGEFFSRFVTSRVDKTKVEAVVGDNVGGVILLRPSRKSWESGSTYLVFSQTNLTSWNSDEKALLVFLTFTSIYLSDGDIAGVAKMLRFDKGTVVRKLEKVSDAELLSVFGSEDGSKIADLRRREYRQAVVRLRKEPTSKR